MTDVITPAMTPEEWRDTLIVAPHGETGETGTVDADYSAHENPPFGVLVIEPPEDFAALRLTGRARHATAALALHGQPYGFTPNDVREVRDIAALFERMRAAMGLPVMLDAISRDQITNLTSLADRIAALLPPDRGTQG